MWRRDIIDFQQERATEVDETPLLNIETKKTIIPFTLGATGLIMLRIPLIPNLSFTLGAIDNTTRIMQVSQNI